jgi:hypothetical protein
MVLTCPYELATENQNSLVMWTGGNGDEEEPIQLR